jgi:hypothetical protein
MIKRDIFLISHYIHTQHTHTHTEHTRARESVYIHTYIHTYVRTSQTHTCIPYIHNFTKIFNVQNSINKIMLTLISGFCRDFDEICGLLGHRVVIVYRLFGTDTLSRNVGKQLPHYAA